MGVFGAGADSISVALAPAYPPYQTFPLGLGTDADPIAVGDFNGDGIPDLVDISGVHLGTGDGTFSPAIPSQISTYGDADAFATGDFTADGHLDLAVVD